MELSKCIILGRDIKTKELIDNSADVNEVDEFGRTPLHYAVVYSKIFIVHDLLKHGANVHAKDIHGKIPLDFAKGEFIELLMGYMSEVDVKEPEFL